MNNYSNIAVIFIIISFVIVTTVFGVVVLALKMQEFRNNPGACDIRQVSVIAENYLKGTATFQFDGVQGSIKLLTNEALKDKSGWLLTYTFQTTHPGHGNRSSQVLAQVITAHRAVIEIKQCKVTSVICDNSWNLIEDKEEP
ncbi:MAG: hypothetical protein NT082_06640 [Chloroflexi bacterium]|nr:hypothetical protein [Chloroflexota bacterium]